MATSNVDQSIKDNISVGDEQVYKKDIDDLIDYIM